MMVDVDWGKMFYFWGQVYYYVICIDCNVNWGEEVYVNMQFEWMWIKFINCGIFVIVGEF